MAREDRRHRSSKQRPIAMLSGEIDSFVQKAKLSSFALIFALFCTGCNSVLVDEASGATEAEIAERVSSYIRVLTEVRNAEAAADYYTADARLVGPGIDQGRASIVEGLREAFMSGMIVQVNRRTLEIYAHGDAAYEIAQAEDTIISPDGSSTTLRNNMFIRWERGSDGRWRFDRVLLSPQAASGEQ